MPTFDATFCELQAKLTAVVQMLEATVQADEARANAIGSLIVQARQALATVAPDPVPEPEPQPEPSEGEV